MFELSEIVSDSQTYKPAAIRALKAFKAEKTWRPEVTPEARIRAMQTLVNALKSEYDMNVAIPVTDNMAILFDDELEDGTPVRPIYVARKLSIITLLNRFAAIRGEVEEDFESGRSYRGRQRWGVNLFRKVYARQFARLIFNPLDGGFYTELPQRVTEQPVAEAEQIPEPRLMSAEERWTQPVEETAESNVRLSMDFGTSGGDEYTEEAFDEEMSAEM